MTRSSGSSSPLLVALSGGADSVYLLDLLRQEQPAASLLAVHVNHGLRGAESEADEAFCRELCSAWRVPFEARRVELDPEASNLEQRARRARYRALGTLAIEHGIGAVATGHHRDDVLETLLMRWMRGSAPAGLVGPAARSPFPVDLSPAPRLELLRPLIELDAREIRASLRERGIAWREDASNRSGAFTRNRIRHELLPLLEAVCGAGVREDLSAFQRALAQHERDLAAWGFEIEWRAERRGARSILVCERAPLESVPRPVLLRGLHESLLAQTGLAPRKLVLDAIARALPTGRSGHWNLRGDCALELGPRSIFLLFPRRIAASQHTHSP